MGYINWDLPGYLEALERDEPKETRERLNQINFFLEAKVDFLYECLDSSYGQNIRPDNSAPHNVSCKIIMQNKKWARLLAYVACLVPESVVKTRSECYCSRYFTQLSLCLLCLTEL